MSDAKLTYIGPLSDETRPEKSRWSGVREALPWPFLIVVVVPTLLAALYFLILASPRYVSEARFVVRSQSEQSPNPLGLALQGVGVSTSSTDAFAVHEYMKSREAVENLRRQSLMQSAYERPKVDFISALMPAWGGRTKEDEYRGFQRFLTVGYDSTNGISTLRVEAFRPEDAQRIARALLNGGEQLVNRLNDRSSQQAVVDAERRLREVEARLSAAQSSLTAFRNRERFIDPARTATEGGQLIGELMVTVATLRAEQAQVAAVTPDSPQLPILAGRIRAYEAQIATERARLAGDANSLAPKIGVYESLLLDRELANRAVMAARTSLDEAQLDARKQRLYLDQVVEPNLPDKATEPKRLLSILAVFATLMLVYGVGWLVWAGVKEHRQH